MYSFWDTVIAPALEALEPETLVEIGSEQGMNTANLLDFCRERGCKLHVIDPLPKYDADAWQRQYGEKLVVHQDLSLNALPRVGRFEAVLIDGDHNWYTVLNELRIIERRCAEFQQPFPLVFLHDIGWPYGRRDLYYDPDSIPEAYRKLYEQKGLRLDSSQPVAEGGINPGLYNAVRENGSHNGVLTAIEDFLEESRERPEFIKLPGLHGLGMLIPEDKKQNEALAKHLDSLRLTPAALSYLETVEESRIWALIRASEAETRARRQDLKDQLAAMRDTAAAQAAETGRLGSERANLQSRYAFLEAEHRESREKNEILKAQRAELEGRKNTLEAESSKLRERNKALETERDKLKQQNKALEDSFADLRNSTSWRLTMPIRAIKRLTNDPGGTIVFFRTRVSGSRDQSADSVSEPPAVVESPPEPAEKKPVPGMERLTPEEASRVRTAFDADFYLAQYPDVAASGVDPFEHYMRSGWKEGREPSSHFSTRYYLQHAPDVEGAGLNPFVHWVLNGIREKRPALPFHRRLELLEYAPKVSAIIPNYNHAQFLEQRIDSILDQTYENLEVLILDDCSTDDSRAIIERYRNENPGRVRALFNDENSSSVFRQWRKGIENSTGELVWICESDDFCEPDFLEALVKNFKDRSVNIAFGRIQFSDREGKPRQGLDQYREGAEAGVWNGPLTRPARQWFSGGFGVNNVIANVGGCIFRRQTLTEPVWDEAERYSILGDWFLYVHLAGGGQIAYEPSAVAYFRQHGGNTSVASFITPEYYEEHERLMLLLRQRWGVPDETVEAFYEKVAWQYAHHGLEARLGPLESYCDKKKLLDETRERPHILMAFLGFHSGGGEVFPINLANALYEQGHLVSMLALDMTDVNEEMSAALNPGIAVYDCAWVAEYGADRFLADAGVSLIHSHMISLEVFFFERCNIETDIPYLVTLHGSYDVSSLSNERLLRFILGITHFVYTADKNLEPFSALPLSERIFTKLGNAMPEDPRPFPKTRRELGIAEDAVVFTLVARGIQRKGWRAAIAAFQRLRDFRLDQNMHLLLCGDGEETDRHYALHGDDPDITFLGYQPHIDGLYRMSEVALIPTRFGGESFPLSILQALRAGTPVIGTKVGEIENILSGPEGTAGVLIEYQRDTESFTESLREAMTAMLDPYERNKGARAAEQKSKTYSMDKVSKDYTALYENLLAERAH